MGDHVGVVRNDADLRKALADIEKIASEDLPTMSLANQERTANYDWIQALEVSSMTRLAEVVIRASLERTESRGAHYREDFPDQDYEKWLRNIVVRKQRKALSISSIPVDPRHQFKKAG